MGMRATFLLYDLVKKIPEMWAHFSIYDQLIKIPEKL
jgi:hypothetical protein